MRRINNYIVSYWFSLNLSAITLYLSYLSFRQYRYFFGLAAVVAVLIKVIGLTLNNRRLRIAGIVSINVIWALTILDFAKMGQPFYFSLFALLTGVGISIKGRFNDE